MNKKGKARSEQQSTMAQALAIQATGDLNKADKIYKNIIKKDPLNHHALFQRGFVSAIQGNYFLAKKQFTKAANINPDDPMYYFNLGQANSKLDLLDEAKAAYEKSLQLDPHFVEAYYSLGGITNNLGQYDMAVTFFKRGIEINKKYAPCYYGLGSTYNDMEKYNEARPLLEKAISMNPNDPAYYFNLGLANSKLDLLDEAKAAYEKSLQLNPHFVEALCNLGEVTNNLGQYDIAETCFKRGIEINKKHVPCYCGLGSTYINTGKYNEALPLLEKAIDINPEHTPSLIKLANLYERLSQLDRAEEYVNRTLAIDSTNSYAICIKASILRRKGFHSNAIKVLLDRPTSNKNRQVEIEIHAELGRLFDISNDTDKAYYHFSESNRLMATTPKGIIADKHIYLNTIKKISEGMDDLHPIKMNNHTNVTAPVFLVGFPRSGTTLLDQILDNHEFIQVMEEKPTISSVITKLKNNMGQYPEGLSTLTESEIDELRDTYFSVVDSILDRNNDTAIIVDKMPLNIIHVGLILRIFPNAKFILALRHPCDAILSCFMQTFEPNSAMANFYTLEDSVNLYVKTMRLWHKYTQLMPVKFHAIKYESLLSDFDNEVKALLGFLGLKWNNDLRDFFSHAKNNKSIRTPSYSQVTQPIYQTSKYRWLRYKKHFYPYIEDLRPFLEYFHYSS